MNLRSTLARGGSEGARWQPLVYVQQRSVIPGPSRLMLIVTLSTLASVYALIPVGLGVLLGL